MKKKIVGILLCGLILCAAGCGKQEGISKEVHVETVSDGDEAKNENTASVPEAAVNEVYPDADELVEIPMGGFIDGQQVDLVNVKMPLNYVFSALYQNEDMQAEGFEDAYGSTLEEALDSDFQREPYAVNDVYLGAYGESGTSIRYMVADNTTFDEMKEYAKTGEGFSDYTEKVINGIDVIYYKDNSAIATDLIMIYPLNETTVFCAYYNGSLADELSMDQLAENICDLITVIH